MEEIDYSVLYRWFVGLSMDEPIWVPTTFTKNRARLLDSDIAGAFFDAVREQAAAAGSSAATNRRASAMPTARRWEEAASVGARR